MIVTKAKGNSDNTSQKIANAVALELSAKSSLATGHIVNKWKNVKSVMNK